jgi:hypothetical protein
VRAAGSDKFNRARSSVARLSRIFFSLTKTYMDVGNWEFDFWIVRHTTEIITTEHFHFPLRRLMMQAFAAERP